MTSQETHTLVTCLISDGLIRSIYQSFFHQYLCLKTEKKILSFSQKKSQQEIVFFFTCSKLTNIGEKKLAKTGFVVWSNELIKGLEVGDRLCPPYKLCLT